MRWVLPGGAVLGGRNRQGNVREAAFRPQAAVFESMRRLLAWAFLKWLLSTVRLLPGRIAGLFSRDRLPTVKLWLEILGLFIGLIGAILALLAGLRK
jgi:hypothetical protein